MKIRDLNKIDRPSERILRYGAGALSNIELLAAIGRFSDLATPARMLAEAGSMYQLGQMPLEEMQRYPGCGLASAAAIKAAFGLGERIANHQPALQVTCPDDLARYLMPVFALYEQEALVSVLLNTKNYVLKHVVVYLGNVDTTIIRAAEVFREAVRLNATAIIIAHNHPSGDPTPSPQDVTVSRSLIAAGQQLGIELLDHLIIAPQTNRWESLKTRGLGFD